MRCTFCQAQNTSGLENLIVKTWSGDSVCGNVSSVVLWQQKISTGPEVSLHFKQNPSVNVRLCLPLRSPHLYNARITHGYDFKKSNLEQGLPDNWWNTTSTPWGKYTGRNAFSAGTLGFTVYSRNKGEIWFTGIYLLRGFRNSLYLLPIPHNFPRNPLIVFWTLAVFVASRSNLNHSSFSCFYTAVWKPGLRAVFSSTLINPASGQLVRLCNGQQLEVMHSLRTEVSAVCTVRVRDRQLVIFLRKIKRQFTHFFLNVIDLQNASHYPGKSLTVHHITVMVDYNVVSCHFLPLQW